jgi:hypothetical protein
VVIEMSYFLRRMNGQDGKPAGVETLRDGGVVLTYKVP